MQLNDEKQSYSQDKECQLQEGKKHPSLEREASAIPTKSGSSQISNEANSWNGFQIIEKIAIPLTIAGLGILFSLVQWQVDVARGEREQKLAHARDEQEQRMTLDNQHHQILSGYLDQMTRLLLVENSGEVAPAITLKLSNEAKPIARARTLSTLRQLDGERKGQLLKFLYEAGLIGGQCQLNPNTLKAENCQPSALNLGGARLDDTVFDRPIPLPGVDLTEASLPKAKLPEIDLTRAEMQKANLSGANLEKAILFEAQMENVRLVEAILVDANLSAANLTGAVLEKAKLQGTKLVNAVLSGADLTGANLDNANLQDADLTGANLTGVSLQGADLKGAIYNGSTDFPKGFDPAGKGMLKK